MNMNSKIEQSLFLYAFHPSLLGILSIGDIRNSLYHGKVQNQGKGNPQKLK